MAMTTDVVRYARGTCLLLLVLASGCASSGHPVDAGAERRDGPRMERDDFDGFTVTEVVRIGSETRSDYQHAMAMLSAAASEQGAALLRSVVDAAPDLVNPHIDLAITHERLGDLAAAERELRAALQLAPDHPVALNELGIVDRRLGRFDEARANYEHALAVHPRFHFALRNLAVLCDLYLEDLECALDNYRRYADVVADDPEVRIWISDLESRLAAN